MLARASRNYICVILLTGGVKQGIVDCIGIELRVLEKFVDRGWEERGKGADAE